MSDTVLNSLKDKNLYKEKHALINGHWVGAKAGKTFDVIDPYHRTVVGQCPEMGKEDCDAACQAAANAFVEFKKTSGRERARMLRTLNDALLEHKGDLAAILVKEVGKPRAEAEAEVMYAASFVEWFSGEAERTYGDVIPSANAALRIHTIREPIGPVAALCPWNLPLAMATRKVGAALAAGCTTVLKPAGETPMSSLALGEICQRVGYKPGVVNVVTCLERTAECGEALCKNEHIRKVTFTGSTRVGKILAKHSADGLKKLTMECGGNAPSVVFNDADIEKAITCICTSKSRCAGQTCVAANRIFVQSGIYEKFTEHLIAKFKTLKQGEAYDKDTAQGPLIHEKAIEKATQHVQDAIKKGAKVAYGPTEPPKIGPKDPFFYPSTVLTGITSDMLLSHEETFAPIASLRKFESADEVIKEANNTTVGLGSYVYTTDLRVAAKMSEELETGMVGINVGILSACESAFGGIKESGYGKEGSRYGLDDYMVVKCVQTDVA